MPDLVSRLAHKVASRIRRLGFDEPNLQVVGTLLELAYLGSLRSEEGKFVKGSLTFANPKRPDVNPPLTRRAHSPAFTRFESPETLTLQTLVKLARAIDRWSASIAVYATRRNEIVAWGVVDQLVQQNVRRHHESRTGLQNPGLLTVTMDGIGDISAYHGDMFLGSLRAQALITRENDALASKMVCEYAIDALEPYAKPIARVVRNDDEDILWNLLNAWIETIARLRIGLRQRGTGGAFLLTPKPIKRILHVGQPFAYARLRDSTILSVLDDNYALNVEQRAFSAKKHVISEKMVTELLCTDMDAEDRELENTGAVKLVASLAAVDGLVLMTPALSVTGFGVKIGSTPNVTTVYDGVGFSKRGTRARKIELSQFGTRHGSMLRYCAQDRKALGIVVSQDGDVRLIMTVQNRLVFWDNLKLLNYTKFSSQAVSKTRRESDNGGRRIQLLGFSAMPKTIDRLMKVDFSNMEIPGSQSATRLGLKMTKVRPK